MKLGLVEVCYIKPVNAVVSSATAITSGGSGYLMGLSLFIDKLCQIGFTMAMCIVVLKVIQCIICMIKGEGDLNEYANQLKRYSLGAVLLYLVPRIEQITTILLNVIFK